MNKIKGQYRQGDVFIQKVDTSIPNEAQQVNHEPEKQRTVLEFGEVTGHAHALLDKTSTLYEWNGDRLLSVTETTPLKHEEHASIQLAPGTYDIRRQTEYTPAAIRNVAD